MLSLRAGGMMHYGPWLELLGFCWVFARLLASSTEFIGCDLEVSRWRLKSLTLIIGHIVLVAAVFSHILVPRAGTIGLECEYYFIVCTKGSQWLLCNLAN